MNKNTKTLEEKLEEEFRKNQELKKKLNKELTFWTEKYCKSLSALHNTKTNIDLGSVVKTLSSASLALIGMDVFSRDEE